jgi:hypothetical protein
MIGLKSPASCILSLENSENFTTKTSPEFFEVGMRDSNVPYQRYSHRDDFLSITSDQCALSWRSLFLTSSIGVRICATSRDIKFLFSGQGGVEEEYKEGNYYLSSSALQKGVTGCLADKIHSPQKRLFRSMSY